MRALVKGARSLQRVIVTGLLWPEILIEIDVIAYI